MKISLIVPAFNEEEGIGQVIEEYYPYVDEMVIIDNGSWDKTSETVNRYRDDKVKLSRHEINQGKVGGLMTGLKKATGDVIVFTDADCTYPARYIPDFVKELEQGADLVLGTRMVTGDNIPLFNRLGNSFFSILATFISGKSITDGQTGFRAFKRSMYESLHVSAKSLEFEIKMTVRAAKLGYTIVEIPIEYRKRVGESKLHSVRGGYRMFRALLSIAWYETSPLGKMISVPGVIFSIVGFLFGLYSLLERLSHYYLVHEYYPLISVCFILFGVQLTSIGLIIDYMTKKLDRIEERLKRK
jgi:glycosyltransferase involved in cell wall biosynthesis